MDEKTLEIRRRMRDDFEYFAPRFLRIKPEEGGIIPFIPTEQQMRLHEVAERQLREKGRVRIIIGKGRKGRVSTYIQARFFHKVIHRKGVKAFVAAHDAGTTNELFSMVDRMYRNFPVPAACPVATNNSVTSMEFAEIDSGYSTGTAGSKQIGRGFTPHYLHLSEAAYFDSGEDIARGLVTGVPDTPGTEIWIESTGNGLGDWFHSQVQAAISGQSDFEFVFLEWWLEKKYRSDEPISLNEEEERLLRIHPRLTKENLAWRRKRIALYGGGEEAKMLFRREFPMTVDDIFATSDSSYIPPDLVAEAIARPPSEAPDGPLVVGIDPGGGGSDPTAVVAIKGHRFLKYWTFNERDPDVLEGKIGLILKELQPKAIFVDSIGIGRHLVSNLSDRFPGVRGIDYRRTASDEKAYANKRAECAGLLKEWLRKASLPDDNLLRMELSAFRYKHRANGQLVLESKEDARDRGVKSPNVYDATALAVSEPVESGLLDDTLWLTWPHKPIKGKTGSEQLPKCLYITAYAWITDEQWCIAIVGVFVPDPITRDIAGQRFEIANAIVLKCIDGSSAYEFMDTAAKLWEAYEPDYFFVPTRATILMKDLRIKNLVVRRAKFDTVDDVVAVAHDALKQKCAWVRNTGQGQKLKARLARYPNGSDQAIFGCIGLALAHLRQRGNIALQYEEAEEKIPRRKHGTARRTAY